MVGVVGAGAMGAGIAQLAALAGHKVRLFDTRPDAAQRAIEGTVAAVEMLVAKGRLAEEQVAGVRTWMSAANSLEDLTECGLIVEAIVENLQAKQALFRSLEEITDADALLATNTSSISITSIASALKTPDRLLGMHFFNPAPVMPLVEIISGVATSRAAAATLYATAKAWGKIPVYAKSSPGFIVNRVARPFYAEALRVLNEGGSDCVTIDAILREAGGFRMGPFELMDLIGHDVNYAVTRSIFDAFYGDSRFTPSLLQLELVEAGFLGRKSGRGFYSYGNNKIAVFPQTSSPSTKPDRVRIFGVGHLADAFARRLGDLSVAYERIAKLEDGRLAEADEAVLYPSDGRTATARAQANGVANTILVDLTLDACTATRLAITRSDTCSASAFASAIGLLQAAGYCVSEIDDIPGMVVLRTVAMLANEAADAVNQGVCNVADCDLAMRKGVNYPAGPLEWADKLGLEAIVETLDNLRAAYGDTRYRVSPLLRRKALTRATFHEMET